MVAATTAYRIQNAKMGCYQSGPTYRKEPRNSVISRCFWAFNYIYACIKDCVLIDPACGSGGFLIRAFEYLHEKIENDIKKQKEILRKQLEGKDFESKSEEEQTAITKEISKMQNALNGELDTANNGSRMYMLSRNCIYGTDANPRMARTSKMNMIMHGDGHGGVHHHDGLLNVNGIFEERFDVILTNPPFGQNVDRAQIITEADKFTDEAMKRKYREKYGSAYDNALKQVDDHLGQPLISLYDLGSVSTLTEVLFMERCLHLLKKGGRMGIVLPEGVLNNKNLKTVREYFEGRAKLILICSIPQDVFIAAGATVKPSLVFMRKFTDAEEKKYKECQQAALKEATAVHQTEIDSLQKTVYDCDVLINSLKEEIKIARHKLNQAKKNEEGIAEIKAKIESIQQNQKSSRETKKAAEKALKNLMKQIKEEAKPAVKRKFDYNIPIAKIDDAGITTTGTASEGNQLPELVKAYNKYRKENNLWNSSVNKVTYMQDSDGRFCRVVGGKKVILNEQ